MVWAVGYARSAPLAHRALLAVSDPVARHHHPGRDSALQATFDQHASPRLVEHIGPPREVGELRAAFGAMSGVLGVFWVFL